MTVREFISSLEAECTANPKSAEKQVKFATSAADTFIYVLSIYDGDKDNDVWIDIGNDEE